jgi:hypothetical protein
LTIRNGSASQNGGGINNSGTLTINKSIITGNVATELNGRGGGINNSGTLTITNSTITGNVAREEVYGFGGGVSNLGTLTIYTSTISGNRADAGGGIFTTGTLTIYTSTISGNSSGNNAGIGGGIFQDGGGTLTINNSTISSNIGTFYGAGIGAANVTTLTINNSTISGNSGSLYGAGIYKWRGAGNGGTVSINNSTISGNSAIYYGGGGGIEFADGDALTLQNTIVANNSGGNCDTGPYGAIITSNGYNLSSDDSCSLTGPGDMNNTDPKLGKFGKYGGPTRTILLLPGSPAIDAGNPNGCTDDKGKLLKTDQRGWPRPGKYDTGGCDIGAFERQKD